MKLMGLFYYCHTTKDRPRITKSIIYLWSLQFWIQEHILKYLRYSYSI